MPKIDSRLLEPEGKPEIAEDFNRVLEMMGDVEGTPGPAGPQGEPGASGPAGTGIKTITGSIDSSNKLTLTFTMTDNSTQTVEGTITPPAAG